MGGQQDRPGRRGRTRLALRLAGGGLLMAAGAIHLDLYLTGYRSIPVIGWLFLLQVIAAFGLGAVVLVSAGSLTAAAGAVFALATLGGYLLSLWTGLFGFTEVRTTAGIAAGVIEVAAFAALTGLAAMPARRGRAGRGPLARLRTGAPGTGRVVSVSVAAVASCDLQGVRCAAAGQRTRNVRSHSAGVASAARWGRDRELLKLHRQAGVPVLRRQQERVRGDHSGARSRAKRPRHDGECNRAVARTSRRRDGHRQPRRVPSQRRRPLGQRAGDPGEWRHR
jgi:hypothetical protein